MKDAVHP